MSHVLVDSAARWREAAAAIRDAERLAVDVEADGFHRYPERTALIQVAVEGRDPMLVDPLALQDLGVLAEALADPTRPAILHSAGYDVRALDRDFGYHLGALYDTSIAAAFVGHRRLGLGNVTEEVLGIHLAKQKRLQRFDWSRRPLPDDALAYAAGDVAHLLALADALHERVEALERTDWVEEECARLAAVRYEPPPPPEEAWTRLKGARDLGPRERAVLREVFVFRDAEARRLGRPPYHVMSNEAMLALAQDPDRPLSELSGLRRGMKGDRAAELRRAVERGKAAVPIRMPRSSGRSLWTSEARERLKQLKRWRKGEADRLDLGPGTVWPAAHLERLSLEPDADPRRLDTGSPPDVRDWQWRELGDSLLAFLARMPR